MWKKWKVWRHIIFTPPPSPCHKLSHFLRPPPPSGAWHTLWTAPYLFYFVRLAITPFFHAIPDNWFSFQHQLYMDLTFSQISKILLYSQTLDRNELNRIDSIRMEWNRIESNRIESNRIELNWILSHRKNCISDWTKHNHWIYHNIIDEFYIIGERISKRKLCQIGKWSKWIRRRQSLYGAVIPLVMWEWKRCLQHTVYPW